MQAFDKFITRSVVFYTDGSKMEDGEYVGSACFSPQPVIQLMHKISPYAFFFSAEAWAIYNAILLLFDIHASDATIITDSMSVLKALQGIIPKKGNYLIHLIKAKLEAVRDRQIYISDLSGFRLIRVFMVMKGLMNSPN